MTQTEAFFLAIPVVVILFSILWYFLEWLFTTPWWCDTFHHGGTIKSDHTGQLNWQCDNCGRWHYKREL